MPLRAALNDPKIALNGTTPVNLWESNSRNARNPYMNYDLHGILPVMIMTLYLNSEVLVVSDSKISLNFE